MDQQDHEARATWRKLEETANTSVGADKSFASFKADFCDVLKQVEQADTKSKFEVQEKQYPEIVRVCWVGSSAFPNISERWKSVLSSKVNQDIPKGCDERKTHRSHPVLESKLLNVHLIFKVIIAIDIQRNMERNAEDE